MMTAKIKGLVSKKKIRYQEDGFDLDLSYISENILAMGFPAQKFESVYRNHIDDVARFLETKHKDHYRIYNLCSERHYDVTKFKEHVVGYPFDDHNPPEIKIMKPFCEDVDKWLSQNEKNVAVVHCKAGKGRTGVMICSYMLHKKLCETPSEALELYGKKRTIDQKGVTVPSQRRYVEYYGELVKKNKEYKPFTLLLRSVHLSSTPCFNGGPCNLSIVVHQEKSYSSPIHIKKSSKFLEFDIPEKFIVCGDIKIEFFNKPKMMKKEKIFKLWFNTFFVGHSDESDNQNKSPVVHMNGHSAESKETTQAIKDYSNSHMDNSFWHSRPIEGDGIFTLTFRKEELDKASKDKTNKHFPADFKVELQFSKEDSSHSPDHKNPSLNCCFSDNSSSHGEASSDNEVLDESDTDESDDEESEGCESSQLC